MEQWTEIRRKVLVEKAPRSARSAGTTGSAIRTLDKILANAEPPGYPRGRARAEAQARASSSASSTRSWPTTKTRRPSSATRPSASSSASATSTATRAASSQVRVAVAAGQALLQGGLRPARHPPGRCPVRLRRGHGRDRRRARCKAALAVMTLPYSDAYFVSAYPTRVHRDLPGRPRRRRSSSSAACPIRTAYDNTTIAVSQGDGHDERELTREFLRLESHYLFDHRFCRVGRGNEKGHVENHVGYSPAQLVGPGAGVRLVRRAERVPRRLLLCRPVPPGPGQGRHQGASA